MCFGGKIDVVQQKSFGNLLQVSSSQDLSVMIKTIKVMSFLMKIISSFKMLRLFISIRLIDEYIRAIRERKKCFLYSLL